MNDFAKTAIRRNRLPFTRLFALALLVTCTPGCEERQVQALRQNTLGVAYMNLQRTNDALVAFEEAWALDPTLDAARLNQAIALFNIPRYEAAEPILVEITTARPDDVQAWYNLGLVYRNTGRSVEAAMAFGEAVRIDPEDADSWYLLGQMRAQLQEYPAATSAYDRALELNPFHVSAEFGLMQVYFRLGELEEGQEHRAQFERIESENLGVPMGAGYGDQGPYSLAVDANSGGERAMDPIGVRFVAVEDASGIDFVHSRSASGSVASFLGGGACFLDLDMDGQIDVFLQNGIAEPGLYRSLGGGRFGRVEGTLPSLPTDGTGCAAGDYDNDGDTDLVLGFPNSVRLLSNDGSGRFSDVSTAAGIAATGLPLGVTFVDFDHDGDLDLYAARFADIEWEPGNPLTVPPDISGPGNLLWRNNGDGTFIDWTGETALQGVPAGVAAIGADLNNDRAIDFVTTGARSTPGVFLNPREGNFLSRDWLDQTPSQPVGIALIDFNKDGWMDLAFTHWGEPALSLWTNLDGSGFEAVDLPDIDWENGWGITALDYDNDGWMDLAAAGEAGSQGQLRILRNLGIDGFEDVSQRLGLETLSIDNPRALITADADTDGDVDLFLTQNDGPVIVLRNDGGNRNPWLRVAFEGLNDNNSAIGTKVEIFAGTHRQKVEIHAASGYLGQNALTLIAGLGANSTVETVRMLWPTGVVQDEVQLATGETHDILEIDRRGSSCPVLFAWNGSEYAFITDMIGAGVVGHWVAPGLRNVSDPTEYVRVPASSVASRDGRLSFRLVEPMEELVYLDQARLLALDHPSDVDVYPHEYFAAVPPFPEFEIIASRDARLPVGAWDSGGRDVLGELSFRDGIYVNDLVSVAFKGFAETHTLELDLGELNTTGPLRLLMHGYVDYFSATSVYAAHQAGVTAILPYIDALDSSGNWVRIVDDLGFPAGLIRTMARDITGRIPEGTRRIRITTNLKVYWDQILIDSTSAEPRVEVREVPLDTAALDWHGYPRAESGSLASDVRYDYDDVSPTGPYVRHAGYYTEFGDVTELIGGADDRFVIFGSGEQVALEFDPSELPPVQNGWTRDYFFFADGFAKDMDFYEAHSATVGPLPFHTEEPYPYQSGAAYPTEAEFLDYQVLSNTRPSSGNPEPSYRFEYPE